MENTKKVLQWAYSIPDFFPLQIPNSININYVCLQKSLHEKWNFSLRISLVNVILTEEILNEKLHFY